MPSNDVALRFSNQKVNITILHKNPIQNPYQDIKLVLMQNGNPITAKLNSKPTYVKPGSLIYNEVGSNDYKGSNEFRKFDFRSLRYKGAHVQDVFMDSTNNIILFTDQNGTALKYTQQIDENGAFFIRNQDNRDNETDSDYGRIQFSLNTVAPGANGDVYIVGSRFNNYTLTEENKMNYVASKKKYYATLYLKQGIYDYQYVWKDNTTENVDNTVLEGSFFETENTYQAFVYFRRPGSRWDELIGYSLFNNIQK
ncbi:type IX secretion system plug protein [Pedobacter sp. NJ-S-72]